MGNVSIMMMGRVRKRNHYVGGGKATEAFLKVCRNKLRANSICQSETLKQNR